MSLANAKEQLLQQYWMTLLHYDWSDLCVMDRMDGFVQSPSFSLWFFTEWVCDKKKDEANKSRKHIDNQARLASKVSPALSHLSLRTRLLF